MPKLAIISISLCALILVGLIPFLEISDTHLTNPDRPSHARLHNAWQLLTNGALSILALVLVWQGRVPKFGIGIALIIIISFFVSLILGSLYGGSMLRSDGTQMALAGVNVTVIVVSILTVLLLLSYRAVSTRTRN
jgi:hypothetical protein